jgi:hypothetical protein
VGNGVVGDALVRGQSFRSLAYGLFDRLFHAGTTALASGLGVAPRPACRLFAANKVTGLSRWAVS